MPLRHLIVAHHHRGQEMRELRGRETLPAGRRARHAMRLPFVIREGGWVYGAGHFLRDGILSTAKVFGCPSTQQES